MEALFGQRIYPITTGIDGLAKPLQAASVRLSRPFHKYAHVFLGRGRGLKLGKKAGEVAPGECPLEGLTEDLPMILEV